MIGTGKPKSRRFRVLEWTPDDGGMPGWEFKDGRWRWTRYPPRQAGEFFVITRVRDGLSAVVPKRWWKCDPSGMPRDDDGWAADAWAVIVQHYDDQRNWRFA